MSRSSVIFSYAFRPFFLLSGLAAILVVATWILSLRGHAILALPANPLLWHGHEMLVGFVMATIAGFVLTAVATWTGRKPLNGVLLLLLVVAWIVGRIAMAVPHLPPVLAALGDMLFPIALCVLVAREVCSVGNRRNYPIVAVMLLLALANGAYHLASLGFLPIQERTILYLLLHTVLLLVTVIGGRVVPNFTANWMRGQSIERPAVNHALVDRLTISSTLVLGILASVSPAGAVTGVLAIATAVLHALRLSQWRGLTTLRNPLLFVLHASYAWLPIGYALLGLAILGGMGSTSGALHALAMGGIGSMILSMMTRVPLGHTGRPLHASRMTVVAYLAMFIAVLLRISAAIPGLHYLDMVSLAALAWGASFAIFLYVYAPILLAPRRQDGGPD